MKYERQVGLLIDLIPSIASDNDFALKGGTDINLFYNDMPRLSVDLDLVYLPILDRDITLSGIDEKLKFLRSTIEKKHPYLRLRANPSAPALSRQLLCRHYDVQVKIEVNPVIRGTLYPVTLKSLSQPVQDQFKKNAHMQVVSPEDLFGSKICAALDRLHPRDLFDMMLFFQERTLTRDIFNAFLFYLISHNRPIAEVINPTLLDIQNIYEQDFVGMTRDKIEIESLLKSRDKLITSIHACFTQKDKDFLLSFKKGEPDWDLYDLAKIQSFPSVAWKLKNIKAMTNGKRQKAYENLETILLNL
jgi:predicted nucleotidyltransferase component of viral defense system